MARKRYNHSPKNKNSIPEVKSTNSNLKKGLVIILAASLLFNVFFFTNMISKKSLIETVETAAMKSTFSISNPAVLRDSDDKNFKIKVGEIWDNKLQRELGFTAQFPIPNFPDGAVIFDAQMSVYSIGMMDSFSIGGAKTYLGSYFHHFNGLTIDALAGNNGIFKPDEEDLNKFAETFKESFLKTFKMVFLYAKGNEEFKRLFPNGLSLAGQGDFLKTFQGTDVSGKKWTLSDLKGENTALIYVDVGCGTCKSKCGTVRDLLTPYGIKVIFITDANEIDSERFITDYARTEPVICDSNRSISNVLYLGEAPYLMLIDGKLKIHYKDAINSITEDIEPAIVKFVK
ncbi:MAG: redoxin domain-containing protein [Caldisericia bacterium]|nr:redoxin domain-containing protein [Caldisericia bacterium]